MLAPVLFLPAEASAAESASFAAEIDQRPVAAASERRPIRLYPRRVTTLQLRITNTGSEPFEVRTVRLEGQVMALTFFAYDTSVSVAVAPGSTETRTFQLDLVGLKSQAVGLIPASVSLLDADRHLLASQRLVVDVRGSTWSVYGAFGVAIAVLTAISLGGALIALAGQRLPENRWRRGLRFLTPGLGIGLLGVFTLSALRVFVPRPGRWLPIVLVSAAVLFVLGYLTPSPDEYEEGDEMGEPQDTEVATFPTGAEPEGS